MNHTNNGHTAPDIHVQLVHIDGPFKGTINEFNQDRITIGRDPTNDIVFPAELRSISRHHAELVRHGNDFTFISLGKNSCLMNQTALDTCELSPGDMIWLTQEGPKISFLSKIKQKQPDPVQKKKNDAQLEASLKHFQKRKTQTTEFTFQYEGNIKSMHKAVVRLGSDEACDFVIDHISIAAFQAEIIYREEQLYLRDISGKNSTLVNEDRAFPEILLQESDHITLGDFGPKLKYLGTGRFSQVHEKESVPDTSIINIFDTNDDRDETARLFLEPRTPNKGISFFRTLISRIWP